MKYQIQNVSIRNIWIACVCKIKDVKKIRLVVAFNFYLHVWEEMMGKLDMFGMPLVWVDEESDNIRKE